MHIKRETENQNAHQIIMNSRTKRKNWLTQQVINMFLVANTFAIHSYFCECFEKERRSRTQEGKLTRDERKNGISSSSSSNIFESTVLVHTFWCVFCIRKNGLSFGYMLILWSETARGMCVRVVANKAKRRQFQVPQNEIE